jgi:hypothetical protein
LKKGGSVTDEKKSVEEAAINAYMESLDGESLTDEDRREYLWAFLEEIRRVYKNLLAQKEQAKRMGNEEGLNQLTKLFRKNYEGRRDAVLELRRLGEKVDDKFVPDSAR